MQSLCEGASMGNSVRTQFIQYMVFFCLMIFIMSFIFLILSPLFGYHASATDMVHLGLVGQVYNDYGAFTSVNAWEYEEMQDGNIVKREYAFCSTSKGIVIFDIDKKSAVSFLPLGSCSDIEIAQPDKKDALYGCVATFEGEFSEDLTGLKGRFYIINVDDPKKPYYVAFCDIPFLESDIAVSNNGNYAFISSRGGNLITYEDNGLYVIDIKDKSKPVIVGRCDTPGHANSIAISGDGNYAFIADGDSGLCVIDIKDETASVIVGGCDTPGNAEDVAISGDGNYAVIVDGGSSLQVIDVSDKTGPVIVGSRDILSGYAKDVAISGDGNYAFIAADVNFPLLVDGVSSLQVIDISDKTKPVIVGNCDTSGDAEGLAISTDGNYAFMAGRDTAFIFEGGGLQVINISEKIEPVIVGRCDTSSSYAKGVAISGDGNYAFIADGGGLQAINIDNKSELVIIGSCDTPGDAAGVTISGDGNYAFIADGGDLQVVNISNKIEPVIVGRCDTPGYAKDVAISGDGNYAFIADDGGLLFVDGTFLFFVDGGNLQAINISDKSEPVIVGSRDTPSGYAKSVAIHSDGNYAFIADGDGLRVIDIRDKSDPVIVGNCDTPGNAIDVAIYGDGNYAFIAEARSFAFTEEGSVVVVSGRLIIIDISDKSKPVIVGSCDTPGDPFNVTISSDGNYAFIAADGDPSYNIVDWGLSLIADSGGLQVIDISNKSDPKIAIDCDTPGYIFDIALSGDDNYAFVAAGAGGMLKFRINTAPSLKGNLILVAGGEAGSTNTLWPATQALANHVFFSFFKAGYEVYDIWYQNPVFFQDIFHSSLDQLVINDAVPTSERLRQAIIPWEPWESTEASFMEWEKSLRANTGPLYIYLIGHGAEDRFQIMPNQVITAGELKDCITKFRQEMNRQVVVIIESAASGTFIDDLTDHNVTVIASTNDGASYIKPDFSGPNKLSPVPPQGQKLSIYNAFTTEFINNLCPYLDTNTVPDSSPQIVNTILRQAFLNARQKLQDWALSGPPFSDQAPQMALPGSEFTSLHFSKDGINPLKEDSLTISFKNDIPFDLTLIGQDPDRQYIPYTHQNITFFSSDPTILDPNPLADIEIDINDADHDAGPYYKITPGKNGLFTLTGYADPAKDPNLLISAKLTIEVCIDVNENPDYAAGKRKMALIMAGYQGSGDYLWESTNTIGNHAYKSLRAMGYGEDEIYYYNPYLLQDLDNDNKYDEIRGYPDLNAFDLNKPDSPFWTISQKGAKELFLFLVDHGSKEKFRLNPKVLLSASDLVDTMEKIVDRVEGNIIFLYDACYSGSFLSEINNSQSLADKIITITSTDPNQTAYFLNQGMVSFSYPFFDEWFLTHSLKDAFDYAGDFLPMGAQTPCVSDPNLHLIEAWDRENIYYVDESRPAISEASANRRGDQVEIRAEVYSLTGISKVFALVESTQNALTSTLGRAKVSAPELCLALDLKDPSFGPNCLYGGPYTLSVPDPCPNETNYRITIYAVDNSTRPKVATCKIPIGSSIENKTMAVIVYSDPNDQNLLSQEERERLRDQVNRAGAILRSKGLRDDEIEIACCLSTLSEIGLPEDKTLFFYMIGQVDFKEKEGERIPHFYLDSNDSLSPSDLKKFIPHDDPNQRFLILLDSPYAKEYLSSCFPNDNWPKRGAGIAGTSKNKLFFSPLRHQGERLFPCFSNFFFSSILSGASVAQCYRMAENAVSLTWQNPALFLPEKVQDYQTMNHYLSYYLGMSAIPGEDLSLFTDCNARVEKGEDGTTHYLLSLTPHPDAETDEDWRAWVVLASSSGIYQKSMIVDLDPNNQADQISGDEYYQAYFMVEGRRKGDNSKTWTEWQEVAIVHTNDGIGHDDYEFDPDPNIILSDPNHALVVNDLPIRRTFYDPNNSDGICKDHDWMYFKAFSGHIYEIYAQDLSEQGYFIQIALYDPNVRPIPLDPNELSGPFHVDQNLLDFQCRQTGYYLLETRLASSYHPEGVSYILSVKDDQAQEYTVLEVTVIDRNQECRLRRHSLSVRMIDGGKPNRPDIKEWRGHEVCSFKFNNCINTTVDLQVTNNLNGDVIKTIEDVSLSKSSLNRITIDISSIPCGSPGSLPKSGGYNIRKEIWQKAIQDGGGNPGGDGDTDFPPDGDYDGDNISNYGEFCLKTSGIYPTVFLPLCEGKNLYYFPDIYARAPNVVPSNALISPYYFYRQGEEAWCYCPLDVDIYKRQRYYYDTKDGKWYWNDGITYCGDTREAMRSQTYNAVDVSTGGVLYLDLINISSILYLRGFSYPSRNKAHYSGQDAELLNTDVFYQESMKTQKALTTLEQVEGIRTLDRLTGKIDSTYRFFTELAGNDTYIDQNRVYIIDKRGDVP